MAEKIEKSQKIHGRIKGKYIQKSVKKRIEGLFLDNIGKVITREQIIEVATDPKTRKQPENWHQRLSELRTDDGYTILSWRNRGWLRVEPSQKPEKVYEKLILMSSKKDDLIYDPMAGSGTTGAVCKTYKRKCIISDISDEYITLAEKRLGIKRLSQNIIQEVLLETA